MLHHFTIFGKHCKHYAVEFFQKFVCEEYEFVWEENYPVMWQEVWQTTPHNVIISKVITTPNIPNSMCP